ncbi:hypothetical protein GOD93_16385 [Sinorhizobium medicae]|nr:hypothetical protein [Sinorhizobium medicae]
MTNITDLIPEDAIAVADTAEYTAWKSQDGSEAWISMKDPNGFVKESIMNAVHQRIWEEGFDLKKITVPDSRALYVFVKTGSPDGGFHDLINVVVTDFGCVEIIDLKQQEAEAKVRETREFLAEKAQVIAEHMYDVMKDENASVDLRRRAAEFIAEASMPKVSESEIMVLVEAEPNSDAVKFVNALNEGKYATETQADKFDGKEATTRVYDRIYFSLTADADADQRAYEAIQDWVDMEEAANRPTAEELFDKLAKTIDEIVALANTSGYSETVHSHIKAFVDRQHDEAKHARFVRRLNRK